MIFLDGLPTVNRSCVRHNNRVLREERCHGGSIIVVFCLVKFLNERGKLLALLLTGRRLHFHCLLLGLRTICRLTGNASQMDASPDSPSTKKMRCAADERLLIASICLLGWIEPRRAAFSLRSAAGSSHCRNSPLKPTVSAIWKLEITPAQSLAGLPGGLGRTLVEIMKRIKLPFPGGCRRRVRKATKAVLRLACAASSALVRIPEALASYFGNRVGGRSAFVAAEIILSARDPSNPRPCLLWTREAKVS